MHNTEQFMESTSRRHLSVSNSPHYIHQSKHKTTINNSKTSSGKTPLSIFGCCNLKLIDMLCKYRFKKNYNKVNSFALPTISYNNDPYWSFTKQCTYVHITMLCYRLCNMNQILVSWHLIVTWKIFTISCTYSLMVTTT